MSFMFWFPLGIAAGVMFVLWSYSTDFKGIRTMVEQDIADAGDEADVWAAFHPESKPSSKDVSDRDCYRFEELMHRIQLWAVLSLTMIALLILVGPW
jgi:hypothetical protein